MVDAFKLHNKLHNKFHSLAYDLLNLFDLANAESYSDNNKELLIVIPENKLKSFFNYCIKNGYKIGDDLSLNEIEIYENGAEFYIKLLNDETVVSVLRDLDFLLRANMLRERKLSLNSKIDVSEY
jgi:hypothetical protein